MFAQICKALRFIIMPFTILLILLTIYSVLQLVVPEIIAISPPRDEVVKKLITHAVFAVVFLCGNIAAFIIYALDKKKQPQENDLQQP